MKKTHRKNLEWKDEDKNPALVEHLQNPRNMEMLIKGLRIQIMAKIVEVSKFDPYIGKCVQPQEIRNFSRGHTIIVIQEFLPYLSNDEIINFVDFGADFAVKIFMKKMEANI